MTTRILIAPTSFKGSLSADEAARTIDRAAHAAAQRLSLDIETDLCPIADGGEGTAAILAATANAEEQRDSVIGPLDEQTIDAQWFRLDDLAAAPALVAALDLEPAHAPLAIFDAAEIVGLPLVPESRRDPAQISTRGIGRLISRAHESGCSAVVVGLGGTASIDGGIGAASELGWSFLDRQSANLQPVGAYLRNIAQVRAPTPTPGAPDTPTGRAHPTVIALADVSNPTIGDTGAAHTFGPQKGASPDQVLTLEQGLANLAKCCIMSMIPANPGEPGSGAAGALGFGLATFLDARLLLGAHVVLNALSIDSRLARADLVLTGEGHLDEQTAHAKAIAALLEASSKADVPVAAVVGQASPGVAEALDLADIATLVSPSVTPAKAQANARDLLENRAGALLESLLRARRDA